MTHPPFNPAFTEQLKSEITKTEQYLTCLMISQAQRAIKEKELEYLRTRLANERLHSDDINGEWRLRSENSTSTF